MMRATRAVQLLQSLRTCALTSRYIHTTSGPIKDYSKYLSRACLARKPSPIRALQPLMRIPGMISLGGGLPNPDSFPISGMSITVGGTKLDLPNVKEALQYSATPGLPDLVAWLVDYQLGEHDPPKDMRGGVKTILTTGSQDALTKAFEMLLNPGDPLLLESPTYSGALAFLQPFGARLVELPVDGQGIIPTDMERILSSWTSLYPGVPRPRALYTMPTGANPTGATLSAERRRQVYSLAQRFDIIILEDDPYYFLQFGDQRAKTLFSMDTDGRVVRFDSFSKVVSAGLRIGSATGPAGLIDKLELHMQATSLHTSGVSQAVLLALLKHWGKDGLEEHVTKVSQLYKARRDMFVGHANKHLDGLVRFTVPEAGMFVWMEVLDPSIKDTTELIKTKAVDKKVLLLPGSSFYPGDRQSKHVRCAFSVASKQDMEEALRRFRELLLDARK